MIFLINNHILTTYDMDCSETLDFEYMSIAELTNEIGHIVQKSIDKGDETLSPSDIEHILKMTTDVTNKITPQVQEITV